MGDLYLGFFSMFYGCMGFLGFPLIFVGKYGALFNVLDF